MTGHRRESFGDGIANMCHALRTLAARGDVEIVWPVHPNPNVIEPVRATLGDAPHVHLITPLDYLAFTALMMRAHLIVTDSGGIQEEAPTLSKPVLITRDETERPEAVTSGTARLVGTSVERILTNATELLDSAPAYARMANQRNPSATVQGRSRSLIAFWHGTGANLPHENLRGDILPGSGRAPRATPCDCSQGGVSASRCRPRRYGRQWSTAPIGAGIIATPQYCAPNLRVPDSRIEPAPACCPETEYAHWPRLLHRVRRSA